GDNLHAGQTVITADGGDPVVGDNVTISVRPDFDGGSVVNVDNQYPAGTITLRKTLSGPGMMLAKGPFTFRFSCTFAGQKLVPIDKQITVNALTVAVTGLPVGAVCDVEEINAGDSATAVPNTVATGVVVPAEGATPITLTSDNSYPIAPACSLTVNALAPSVRINRNGKTVVVRRATTSSDCQIIVGGGSSSGVKVKCTPRLTTRGDLRYCRSAVGRNGKVVVQTYGYPRVQVAVSIKAVPKPGVVGHLPTTWIRSWRVR
ncbi:MAG: DUF5979 domain-containing protein, partial [Actinomycetes bacterium]